MFFSPSLLAIGCDKFLLDDWLQINDIFSFFYLDLVFFVLEMKMVFFLFVVVVVNVMSNICKYSIFLGDWNFKINSGFLGRQFNLLNSPSFSYSNARWDFFVGYKKCNICNSSFKFNMVLGLKQKNFFITFHIHNFY